MHRPCTLCGDKLGDRAILIQEDPDTRAQQDDGEGGWDWLPMGVNGMHYMMLHFPCWEIVLEQMREKERNAVFMFYMGNIDALEEVVLCLN